jgi:hypothetical protein
LNVSQSRNHDRREITPALERLQRAKLDKAWSTQHASAFWRIATSPQAFHFIGFALVLTGVSIASHKP